MKTRIITVALMAFGVTLFAQKKEIKKERRCLQVNYVTFKTDWPVD